MNLLEIVQLLVPLAALVYLLIFVHQYTGALECSVHKESQQDGGSIAVECEMSPRSSGLLAGIRPHVINTLETTNRPIVSVVSRLLPPVEEPLGDGLKDMLRVDPKPGTLEISGAVDKS